MARYFRAYTIQAMAIGSASTIVSRMKIPTSMLKIPQTPSGPGVGGTRECVITRPAASATPRLITDFLVVRDRAFAIGERTTKPESQKIGMETRKPVRASASSSLPLPKSFRKVYAMRFAAPETSKIWPIMTPKPMMIPMLPSVPPKPPVMEFMMLAPDLDSPAAFTMSVAVRGMPPIRPTTIVLRIRARNACTLVFSTRKISRAMPIRRPINIRSPTISIVCLLFI